MNSVWLILENGILLLNIFIYLTQTYLYSTKYFSIPQQNISTLIF